MPFTLASIDVQSTTSIRRRSSAATKGAMEVVDVVAPVVSRSAVPGASWRCQLGNSSARSCRAKGGSFGPSPPHPWWVFCEGHIRYHTLRPQAGYFCGGGKVAEIEIGLLRFQKKHESNPPIIPLEICEPPRLEFRIPAA